MLKFVKKKEYWDIENSGLLKNIKEKSAWCLKSIQDAIAYAYLKDLKQKRIAEIGGGDSRVLSALSIENKCYNIDEFKGIGNGPKQEIKIDKIKNILTFIGDYSNLIKKKYFDALFSISVIEHVPDNKIDDFFKDCHRILKHNGLLVNLIDIYLEDNPEQNNKVYQRIMKYREVFINGLFNSPEPTNIISLEKDVKFSTSFATNPDNILNVWNKVVPEYKEKRERSQSCTLLMVGFKNS